MSFYTNFGMKNFLKKSAKKFCRYKNLYYICSVRKTKRVLTIKNYNYEDEIFGYQTGEKQFIRGN